MLWGSTQNVNSLPDPRIASRATIYLTPDKRRWVVVRERWVDFDYAMDGASQEPEFQVTPQDPEGL